MARDIAREPGRPDPDALLARIKAQEKPTRGRLRIYLGAAAGVGKTYTMLEEAHRRKGRGVDVHVITERDQAHRKDRDETA